MVEADRDWRAIFDEAFASGSSPTMAAIFREVFGNDYPAELDPHSFITRPELARMVADLALRPGDLLVDVGCGRGGPGLFVAHETGARLIGVDISDAAVAAAAIRAAALDDVSASFQQGTFAATRLPDASADAVMSVDALLFAPSKVDAVRELRRILRPGGRLVLTTWDYTSQPIGRPPQVPDHRPLLDDAGFDVFGYVEIDDWREREASVMALMLERVEALAVEDGEPVDIVRAQIEEEAATGLTMSRHVHIAGLAR